MGSGEYMARTNNYLLQAAQAKRYFLTYDQEALIRKLQLPYDEDFLYPVLFSRRYRLSRKTGDLAGGATDLCRQPHP